MTAISAKRCEIGNSCGSACISRGKECKRTLSVKISTDLSKVKEELPHLLGHVATGVVAWKTGKVLGTMVSSYLESQYGIPKEASKLASESVIQGLTATALSSKEIKGIKSLATTLLSETAAAVLGKTAHMEAEDALASTELREIIKETIPILSGKITGVSVSMGGKKLPEAAGLASKLVQNSRDNVLRLFQSIRTSSPSFSEETLDLKGISEFLGDMAVLSLLTLVYSEG
jgi:hypothetical protein